MIGMWCALLVAASAGAQQQMASPARPTPDQQLSMLLGESSRMKVTGDVAGAIKGYLQALDQVNTEPTLKRREEEVLQNLAGAYIQAKQPREAIRVSRRILALHEEDCKPGAQWVERCADAQYGLGLAMMHDGDFPGAVKQLTASAENFGKVKMEGDETYRMTKLKQRGDAESMLAAALFRSGQREKSLATFRQAIETLKTVAEDEKLDPGTRGSARQSQTDAEASLKLLEGK